MNNHVFYRMFRYGWNKRSELYDRIISKTGDITLNQVVKKLRHIPDKTIYTWEIEKLVYDSEVEGGCSIIGSISADEFIDDVPDWPS